MIIFYHNQYKIKNIEATQSGDFSKEIHQNIVTVLLDFANKFQDEILVWCHESEKNNLNVDAIESLFHHNKFIFSYKASSPTFFDKRLGYIEDSAFIKINKEVRYPSWQMTSQVGAIHASVLNACKESLRNEFNFDYFLNSFSKRALIHGLFCCSEPTLFLKKETSKASNQSNIFQLFKFTKQHYKTRWIFLLFFNLVVYEKQFPLFPFVKSLFYRRRNFNPELLNRIPLLSTKKIIEQGTIDVLIPTIGRKDYLQDVLNNLASQTHLPKNVIIIEQNPAENSASELDFIANRSWPFVIKHHFTPQTGACNARNIGLTLIESDFTFFADDDIVFENDLIENVMSSFLATGNEILLVACHLKSQIVKPQLPKQFPIFGGGHAFVKSACLEGLQFDMAYEFGFGEDGDFGLQLLNKGYDILYISTINIIHLKAPIGGFRTKPILRWSKDEIFPKPSPTVMLYRLKHDTKEQLALYKITLFFKNLNREFFLNPFGYIKMFNKKWDRSIFWATKLRNN